MSAEGGSPKVKHTDVIFPAKLIDPFYEKHGRAELIICFLMIEEKIIEDVFPYADADGRRTDLAVGHDKQVIPARKRADGTKEFFPRDGNPVSLFPMAG